MKTQNSQKAFATETPRHREKSASPLRLCASVAIFVLLAPLWLNAQTAVLFPLAQMTGTTNDTTLTIKPVNNPVTFNSQVYWLPPAGIQLATVNGSATTNLIPNDYTVTIKGVPGSWRISVNDTNVTLNAALIGNLTTYTFNAAPPFIQQLTAGTTNVSFSPANGKGTVVAISVTGGGGGGGGGGSATNAYQSQAGNSLIKMTTNTGTFTYTFSGVDQTNFLGTNKSLAAFHGTNEFDLAGAAGTKVAINNGSSSSQTLNNAVITNLLFFTATNGIAGYTSNYYTGAEGFGALDWYFADGFGGYLHSLHMDNDSLQIGGDLTSLVFGGFSFQGFLIENCSMDGSEIIDGTLNSNKLDAATLALLGTGGSGGSGNVTGPSSSTDGNFVLFNGTTGKVISNSIYNATSFDASGSATSATNTLVATNDLRTLRLTNGANTLGGTMVGGTNRLQLSDSNGVAIRGPLTTSNEFMLGPNNGALVYNNNHVVAGINNAIGGFLVGDNSGSYTTNHSYFFSGQGLNGSCFYLGAGVGIGTNNVPSHGLLDVWGGVWASGAFTSPGGFIGLGTGLTNAAGNRVAFTNELLDASTLGANAHIKTGATTNLISSEDATGYTNTVYFTNYLATTNIAISFNNPASICQGVITNGPDVFFVFNGGDRGSWSFLFTTNVTLHYPPQVKWLWGAPTGNTNSVISFTCYGGTNLVEGSWAPNQ